MRHGSKTATATPRTAHGLRRHHGVESHEVATGKKNGLLLFVLLIAQLMVILDITAVNIALPSLAGDLHLSGSGISWTITSYTLIFGSLLLLGGRAADMIGRRRMFLTGLAVFTASSLASALAPTAGCVSSPLGRARDLEQRSSPRRPSRSSCRPSRAASGRRLSLPGAQSGAQAQRSACLSVVS